MARRQKSQAERDRDDEARLNWFLRAQGTALSCQELAEITGMPASRVLSAIDRLTDDGVVRNEGPDRWRVSRRNDRELISL